MEFTRETLSAFLAAYGNMPNMDKLNFRKWLDTGELPTTGTRDPRFNLLVQTVQDKEAAADKTGDKL